MNNSSNSAWRAGAVRALAAFALGLSLTAATPIVRAADKDETVRAELGKPIQAAQALIKQGKFKEALSKLHEADAIAGRTPYENYALEYTRLSAANSAGDMSAAGKAFEALLASGRLPPTSQQQISLAIASQYYRAGSYQEALNWAQRYQKLGGQDASARSLVYQSQYQSGNFEAAAKALSAELSLAEKAGQKPAENLYQLLANCELKRGNQAGYQQALERLLAAYPKRDYWLSALQGVATRPGFPDRLTLDLARLRLATNTMGGTSGAPAAVAEQYFDTLQRLLQAGYAGEAKTLADKAFSSGILGAGKDAAREQRLRALVDKTYADDRKTLGQGDAEAAGARTGDALLAQGFNYVGYGEFDKGLVLMGQGIAKGGLKYPEDAKLHLGYAQLLAGRKAEAIKTLKTVAGPDGSADLARLWLVQIGH